MTGAHKHKVESVRLALCRSRDNGDWYFSFVSSRIHSQVSDSKPNYTLVCPLKLSRKQMLETPDCCKIGKDWAHFRDFPIVAEQGNEAGNRIFCAKKTWISSYLCHKIFTAPSKCKSVSVFMTKSIIGDIIFIIYCQTGTGEPSIDGCKVNISNSGRAGLCQVIHQFEPLIW